MVDSNRSSAISPTPTAAAIPDTIGPECRGETPTTLNAAAKDDRDRYLAEVRAAEPAITDSDNDLLEAIDLGCGIIGLAVDQGDPPDNPDALMATAWAPLDTLDHAEHVLSGPVRRFPRAL